LRDRWLNPPEWVEWVDEPVPGYPRPVPRDEEAATALKKRTLTNLYNARPQWLVDAHAALDWRWQSRTVGRRTSPTTTFCGSCWRSTVPDEVAGSEASPRCGLVSRDSTTLGQTPTYWVLHETAPLHVDNSVELHYGGSGRAIMEACGLTRSVEGRTGSRGEVEWLCGNQVRLPGGQASTLSAAPAEAKFPTRVR